MNIFATLKWAYQAQKSKCNKVTSLYTTHEGEKIHCPMFCIHWLAVNGTTLLQFYDDMWENMPQSAIALWKVRSVKSI